MCGITGFIDFARHNSDVDIQTIVAKMMSRLTHRGPDSSGMWTDASAGVALGHQRLAILDLSAAGHQPMISANGRYHLVFNGEIYNFLALRSELSKRGHRFQGDSDTEVMLAAFSQWGVPKAVQSFVGMFAFALWDRLKQTLCLGRDRVGEKPLYYGRVKNTFLFASELKALQVHPEWEGHIDRNALHLFMQHSYIPAPLSIYQGIFKLLPATILTINPTKPNALDRSQTYRSLTNVMEQGNRTRFSGTETDAREHLDHLLRETIRQQMIADVPLGVFLSGGTDSSTIAALMQTESATPVKTFTLGFHEGTHNEAIDAKAVAQHLGTDHTEMYVTPQDAKDVIPKLPLIYDEPFSDPSQIPTLLLAQLAKQDVTVCLSGDGGDELFCGYNHYFQCKLIWNILQYTPFHIQKLVSFALKSIINRKWDYRLFPPGIRSFLTVERLYKLSEMLLAKDLPTMYWVLISHILGQESLVMGLDEAETCFKPLNQTLDADALSYMMYTDMSYYLPDDILVKVDRASMAKSLEVRVPLLDHRIVEFVWSLPIRMKYRPRQRKWLLRQILNQYVPARLIERTKMGFGVPIGQWLREPLKDWVETLLEKRRLHQEGFFNPQPIRKKWKEHLSGQRQWQYDLWNVLMFQVWLESHHK